MPLKKIIFAIDDQAAMGLVYQEILGEEFDLHCFQDAHEMLKMSDDILPDLAIIDIGLADLDGYTLCEMLKQKEDMEDVPVIFVTGRDFSEDQGRAFFSGGTEYVTKPVEADKFHSLVSKLLHKYSTP